MEIALSPYENSDVHICPDSKSFDFKYANIVVLIEGSLGYYVFLGLLCEVWDRILHIGNVKRCCRTG